MKYIGIKTITAFGLALLVLVGCGSSTPARAVVPAKPLGEAEQSFLKQVENTPAKDRQLFVSNHRAEVMQFATKNRSFGEELNRIMGIQPASGK